MQEVIQEVFGSLQTQFIDPIGNGLWGIVEPVWYVAIGVAVLGLIFGFGGMKRGAYAGMLIGLLVFGYVLFGWGDRIVAGITDPVTATATQQQSAAAEGSSAGTEADVIKAVVDRA